MRLNTWFDSVLNTVLFACFDKKKASSKTDTKSNHLFKPVQDLLAKFESVYPSLFLEKSRFS